MDPARTVAAGLDNLAAVRARIAALAPPSTRVPDAGVPAGGVSTPDFSALLGTAISRSAGAAEGSPAAARTAADAGVGAAVTLAQMLAGVVSPATQPLTPAPVAETGVLSAAPDLGLAVTARPLDVEIGSGHGPRVHPIHGDLRTHHGVDMGAPAGTSIRAFGAGTVIEAGPRGGYGNLVVIDHGNGITSRYAHQSSLDVEVGQVVTAGDVIGRVGSTGASTGPHLHFEIRRDGVSRDPAPYLSSSAPGRS